MQILDVSKIGINFGYGSLFSDISFTLNEGESVCIVGENGCGKSTLLKIIAGITRCDAGQVSIKKDSKVAYLDQTGSSFKCDKTVWEFLREGFSDLLILEKEIQKIQNQLNNQVNEESYTKTLTKYCTLLEKFAIFGGYDIDINLNVAVDGLGISKRILDCKFDDLSGGEKTLVQLAKILAIKPDLLLLDEPTNHLDISRIEWLEKFIKSFKGASVIVSHDRYFLDRVATRILCLEQGFSKIYNTNYSGYLKERRIDFEKQMAEYSNKQNLIKRLEEQRKFFAEKGMAYNSSTLCDRAHALQTQIERIKNNAITRPKEIQKLKINFNKEQKYSKTVFSIKNISVYSTEDTKILNDINLEIKTNEKIAIIGNNGSGKSTFIKSLMSLQTLKSSGTVAIGPSVVVGYLPQIIDFKNNNQELLEYFKENAYLGEQQARQVLAKFHFFQEDTQKKIGNLSGGEKMRLKLAELMQKKINTLVFDEPTNHIDIPTKEVLETALQDFDGTLIFVSHDRFFINKFAEKIIEFKDGKIKVFLGNYDDYKRQSHK